jgi:hypothetical protein
MPQRFATSATIATSATSPTIATGVFCAALLCSLAGCKKALPDRMEIAEHRAVFATEAEVPATSDAMQRLGTGMQTLFRWTTPAGWQLKPSTEMRQLNFSFGPNQEGECYLSVTKGGEGATAAEINRWRKQMALPPLDNAALDSLPIVSLLQTPCPLLSLEGNYTPAGGMMMMDPEHAPKPLPDYALRGVPMEIPQQEAVITLKMVGPKALVLAEDANFKTLVSSFAANRR